MRSVYFLPLQPWLFFLRRYDFRPPTAGLAALTLAAKRLRARLLEALSAGELHATSLQTEQNLEVEATPTATVSVKVMATVTAQGNGDNTMAASGGD